MTRCLTVVALLVGCSDARVDQTRGLLSLDPPCHTPETYGAVASDGLDDRAALQSAIDTAISTKPHCVRLAPGVYHAARTQLPGAERRTEALARQVSVGQIWRPAITAAGGRTTLREAVHQVLLSLVESLRAHESFWLKTDVLYVARSVGTTN